MFACHGKVYALANEQFKRQWSSQGGAICYHCTTKNGHLREHHCPFCCPVRSYARRQCQLSSCAASPQASQHDQLKPMKPALPLSTTNSVGFRTAHTASKSSGHFAARTAHEGSDTADRRGCARGAEVVGGASKTRLGPQNIIWANCEFIK